MSEIFSFFLNRAWRFKVLAHNHLFQWAMGDEMTIVLISVLLCGRGGHRNSTPNLEVSFSRTRS
jgi:hypothetical protein